MMKIEAVNIVFLIDGAFDQDQMKEGRWAKRKRLGRSGCVKITQPSAVVRTRYSFFLRNLDLCHGVLYS